MTILNGQRVVAIEEHYLDPNIVPHLPDKGARFGSAVRPKLDDVGEGRIKLMDQLGIDVQVLSNAPPGTQLMDAETGVRVARRANDNLHEICQLYPDRFAGFAMLPTADPDASADEFERCVDKLGFKGAMIHGLTGAKRLFFDDKRFWPIFERAESLNAPIYIHPATPHPDVIDAYFKDYVESYPALVGAGLGYAMETATAGVRIVLSGVLDKYPGVKIILGHMGEALPFLLWRIDMALNRPGNKGVAFREIFTSNFYITTSGFFSDPALLCCLQEMGADHILYAIDYPFVSNEPGLNWIDGLMLNSADKAKILHQNAERILGV
jgi:predicted TIM-barrel fold metal-dependent hydrolase